MIIRTVRKLAKCVITYLNQKNWYAHGYLVTTNKLKQLLTTTRKNVLPLMKITYLAPGKGFEPLRARSPPANLPLA